MNTLETIYDFVWTNKYPLIVEDQKYKCLAVALYNHKFNDSVITSAINNLESAEDRYMLGEGVNHQPVLDSEQSLVLLPISEDWYRNRHDIFEKLFKLLLKQYPDICQLIHETEDGRLSTLNLLSCTPIPNYGTYLINLKQKENK